jgi:hypothetical protein
MPGPSLSITTHAKLQKVLQCFINVDITAYTFLTLLLNESTYNNHPCTKDLLGNSSNIFATFLKHPKSSNKTWAWASNLIKQKYSQDFWDLADIESGWHFSALKASEKKLTDFRIEDMAEKMQELAPELWDLLGLMLTANSRGAWRKMEADAEGDIKMDEQPADEEAEYWRDCDDEFFVEEPMESSSDHDRMAKQREALLKIVSSSQTEEQLCRLIIPKEKSRHH